MYIYICSDWSFSFFEHTYTQNQARREKGRRKGEKTQYSHKRPRTTTNLQQQQQQTYNNKKQQQSNGSSLMLLLSLLTQYTALTELPLARSNANNDYDDDDEDETATTTTQESSKMEHKDSPTITTATTKTTTTTGTTATKLLSTLMGECWTLPFSTNNNNNNNKTSPPTPNYIETIWYGQAQQTQAVQVQVVQERDHHHDHEEEEEEPQLEYRCVRFRDQVEQDWYDNPWPLYDDEWNNLWYTPNDYTSFKRMHHFLAREVQYVEGRNNSSHNKNTAPPLPHPRQQQQQNQQDCLSLLRGTMLTYKQTTSYHQALLQTYAACCELADMEDEDDESEDDEYEYDNDDDELEEDEEEEDYNTSNEARRRCRHRRRRHLLVLSEEEEQVLTYWLNHWMTSRHGLERFSSCLVPIHRDRQQRRANLWYAINSIQQDPLLSSSCVAKSSWYFNTTHRAELIRRTCQTITRPSRLFARQVAQAQQQQQPKQQQPKQQQPKQQQPKQQGNCRHRHSNRLGVVMQQQKPKIIF